MKFRIMSAVIGAVLATMSVGASAQFGGMLKGGDSAKGSISADQIVQRYIGGTKSVVNANATMLDAVGLKNESAASAAQAANLTEGATKDALEESVKVQTANSKALETKLADSSTQLDAAGKKKFSAGVSELAKGVVAYVGLGKDTAGFKPGMSSMGGSANSALFVAKSLPASTKNLVETLKMAIDFCKTNKIPVDKSATDATALI
ncbi:MAG: hypothetical protein V4484_17270 [Pseudomonadota bacterium]